MFEVILYEDRKGHSQIREYMNSLEKSSAKDSRIKLSRIQNNIMYLQLKGTRAGERFVKHLDGEIWELRPGDDRVTLCSLG